MVLLMLTDMNERKEESHLKTFYDSNNSLQDKHHLSFDFGPTIQIPLWNDEENCTESVTGENEAKDTVTPGKPTADGTDSSCDEACIECDTVPEMRFHQQKTKNIDLKATKTLRVSSERSENSKGIQTPPKYSVTQIPPSSLLLLVAFQHSFTLLGILALFPLLIVPLMGGTSKQAAELIGTTYFLTGINTLIQTTLIGNRLPMLEVPSFCYLPAALSIIYSPELQAISNPSERFEETMKVLSGSVLIAGIFQTIMGYTGAIIPLLQFISPVTICCIITTLGLGNYNVAIAKVSTCFPIGTTMIVLGIVFSRMLQKGRTTTSSASSYLGASTRPSCSCHSFMAREYAIVQQIQNLVSCLPILTAILTTWFLSFVLTSLNVWPVGSQCRTDEAGNLTEEMPLLHIPIPGQWYGFRFKLYGIVPMLGALLASMTESVGDCYTCASVSGAPTPTPGVVSRGLAAEGLGIILDGLFGKCAGSTAASGQIAIMSMTGVGSRAVVQLAAVSLIVMGMFGKVSATLASLPPSIIGGMFCVVFGSLVSVGLSNMKLLSIDIIRNDRNLFIISFAIFNALSLAGPNGIVTYLHGESRLGHSSPRQITLALFSSPMVIALVIAFVLDNTVAGSKKSRGMHAWISARGADIHNDPDYTQIYALPWSWATSLFHNFEYLEKIGNNRPPPPKNGHWPQGKGDLWEALLLFRTKK